MDLGFDVSQTGRLQHDIKDLLTYWTTPDINPKYYTGFHRLEELSVELFIDFYTHMEFELRRYNICLVPFDMMLPKWQHVGLCLPGIGALKYLDIAAALFNLLGRLLPQDDQIVKSCTTALMGSAHDGFRLLRNIMAKSIPVFCPYIPCEVPMWETYKDVTHMSKMWKIHFRLLAKSGGGHSPMQQSLLFLQSLTDPSLAPHITSIRGQLQMHAEKQDDFEDSDSILPSNLTIDGIVSTLTAYPIALAPSINYAQSSKSTYGTDTEQGLLDFQGFVANFTSSSRRGGRRTPAFNRDKKEKDSKTDIICRGCHRRNHKEVDCRDLAKWIIISGAVESLSPQLKKRVLANYYKFYSSAPPSPSMARSCAQQLTEFCASRNMSTEQCVQCYNWDGYAAADLDGEDDGYVSAQDETESASE